MEGKIILLHELYAELRFYKWKEFLKYIFSIFFFLLSFFIENNRFLFILAATAIIIANMFWIYQNSKRSMKIKKSIYLIQKDLDLLQIINTKKWAEEKSITQHLGTGIYMIILFLLSIILIFII